MAKRSRSARLTSHSCLIPCFCSQFASVTQNWTYLTMLFLLAHSTATEPCFCSSAAGVGVLTANQTTRRKVSRYRAGNRSHATRADLTLLGPPRANRYQRSSPYRDTTQSESWTRSGMIDGSPGSTLHAALSL
jgi:hypothetical protein